MKLTERPYYAVASHEGLFVDVHLGQADCLWIYSRNHPEFVLVEKRKTPPPGSGINRWKELAGELKDCCSLLVNGIGGPPLEILTQEGIEIVEIGGPVAQALAAVVSNNDVQNLKRQITSCNCHGGCGDGKRC
jgi:nitrogen fixation protein NifB